MITVISIITLLILCSTIWNKIYLSSAQKMLSRAADCINSERKLKAGAYISKAKRRLKLCTCSRLIKSKKWRMALALSFYYEAKVRDQRDQKKQLLLKAVKAYPKDNKVLLEIADISLTQQQYSDGIDYAKKAILLKPDDDRALITLATLYYCSGNSEQAAETFSQASRLEDEEFLLQIKSLQTIGRHNEVLTLLDSRTPPSEMCLEQFLCCNACSLAETGSYADALEKFQAAYKINPNNLDVLRNIAHCNYMLNQYEEASQIYSMLRSIQSSCAGGINLQAAFACLACGEIEKAKFWLESCKATDWVKYYLLGKILAESESSHKEQAVEYLTKCLDLLESSENLPIKKDIFQHLAFLYADIGDFDNALIYIHRLDNAVNAMDTPEIRLLEAYCLIGREEYSKAISLCMNLQERSNLNNEDRVEVRNLLITAAYFGAKKNIGINNFLGGGYDLEKLVEMKPDIEEFKKALASIYSKLAQSILSGDEIHVTGNLEREFIDKHGLSTSEDKVEMAERLLEKAERIYPIIDHAFNRSILLIKMGAFARAIDSLHQYQGDDNIDYLIALAKLGSGKKVDAETIIAGLVKSENPDIRIKSKVIEAVYYLCPRNEWKEAAEMLLADCSEIV